MRAVITDNLSGDDSPQRIDAAIRENNWDWATLLPLERNGGFAFGNNAAIRPALASTDAPDFALLLNPDTELKPGAVQALMDFMETHPQAGIAGSRLEDPDGTPQRSAFRFHSIASEFERGIRLGVVSKLLASKMVAPPVPEQDVQTDWVAGASMMIRAKVFLDVARASRPWHGQDARVTDCGLDQHYFMYFEVVDFCRAARRAGGEVWYVPQSRVVHFVGRGIGIERCKKAPQAPPSLLVRFTPAIFCEESWRGVCVSGRHRVCDRFRALEVPAIRPAKGRPRSAKDAGRFCEKQHLRARSSALMEQKKLDHESSRMHTNLHE